MVTSAVNDYIVLNRPVHVQFKLPDEEWKPWATMDQWSRSYRKVRPESMSSPFRSNMTRAPLPWYNWGWSASEWNGQHGYTHEGGTQYRYDNGLYGTRWPSNRGHLTVVAQERAAQKWHEKAKDSKLNLGLALAEAGKTAGLVGQTATTIARQVVNFRSHHPKYIWWHFKRHGKFENQRVTDEYLKMCYGWTPLLSDVDGACRYLADLVTGGRPLTFKVVGQAREKDRLVEERNIAAHLYQEWVCHDESMAKYSVVMSIPSMALRDFASLGLVNPLTLAWELVPYSFVVDWFLPIGGWLDSLDSTVGMQFSEGTLSLLDRRNAIGRVAAQVGRPVVDAYCYCTKPAKYKEYDFRRLVLREPPARVLPSLRAPLSLDKLAKGLSLLVAAFR